LNQKEQPNILIMFASDSISGVTLMYTMWSGVNNVEDNT